MHPLKKPLLLGSFLLLLAGCGGGGHETPAPPPPPTDSDSFVFHPAAPHADPLAYDPQDVAQPMVSPHGHRDGAGVFVYATKGARTVVLLARRAPWLSAPGTWGVFGGSVDPTDVDSAGRLSYSRAAEHELHEESVTVYHQTDANDLRACPTHLKTWRSGLKFRTFFSRQPFIPEKRFNDGYAYVTQQGLPRKFSENDRFLWVRLEDLKACASTRTQTAVFTDGAGVQHTLELFGGFYSALIEPGYRATLNALP